MPSKVTDIRGIIWLFAVAVAVTVACIIAAHALARTNGEQFQPGAVKVVAPDTFPPMGAAHQQQKARERLSEYGWVNAEHTRLHIPVETAIQVWLERQRQAP